MKNDAREAALGLLGLSSQVDLRPLSNSVVPLKRKPSVAFSEPPRERFPSQEPKNRDKESARDVKESKGKERVKEKEKEGERDRERGKDELKSATKEPRDTKRKGKEKGVVDMLNSDESAELIRCICGIPDDDGLSMACDDCGRWVHSACFDVFSRESVPEDWSCWVCKPRPVDKSKAIKVQKARQKMFQMQEIRNPQSQPESDGPPPPHPRKVSPGVERKPRRAIDGSGHTKRRRRTSVSTHHLQTNEDEQVDIDEPAAHDYIHIDTDIVTNPRIQNKLKLLATNWRGATALDSPSVPSPVVLSPDALPGPSSHTTTLRPLPASYFNHSTLSPNTNPSVRPPSYAVHTTQPIPSDGYIAPYTSTILPSSQYLSDPLNAYAHLSIPKPFVHLVGPPLDLALDARLAGRESRYVRNGCRPNAVLRPIMCQKKTKAKRPTNSADISAEEDAAESLSFAIFALRDLKANEEVVLGWEWDDGSVIHHLPALIDSPNLFGPLRFQQFRNQMTSMLHAFSSMFTTCACGTKAKDCALTRLAEFVDHSNSVPVPLTPSPSSSSPPALPHEARHPRDIDKDNNGGSGGVDLGPLIGRERGFRTRERVPLSGGMSGVEMVTSVPAGVENEPATTPTRECTSAFPPVQVPSPPMTSDAGRRRGRMPKDAKGEAEVAEDDMDVEVGSAPQLQTSRSARPPSPQTSPLSESPPAVLDADVLVPPRLRKGWIRQQAQVLRRSPSPVPMVVDAGEERHGEGVDSEVVGRHDKEPEQGGEVNVDDDALAMPPPPLPVSILTSLSAPAPPAPPPDEGYAEPPEPHTSPTARFANLTLLSPALPGPPAFFGLPPFAPNPTLPPPDVAEPPQTSQPLEPPVQSPKPICPGRPPEEEMQVDENPKPASVAEVSVLGEPFQRRSSPRLKSILVKPAPLPAPAVQHAPDRVLSPSSLPNVLFVQAAGSAPDGSDALSTAIQQFGESLNKMGKLVGEPISSPDVPVSSPSPQPASAPPLPPPPPTKKKISMGDYLSRKREAGSKVVSPAVPNKVLAKEATPEIGSAGPDHQLTRPTEYCSAITTSSADDSAEPGQDEVVMPRAIFPLDVTTVRDSPGMDTETPEAVETAMSALDVAQRAEGVRVVVDVVPQNEPTVNGDVSSEGGAGARWHQSPPKSPQEPLATPVTTVTQMEPPLSLPEKREMVGVPLKHPPIAQPEDPSKHRAVQSIQSAVLTNNVHAISRQQSQEDGEILSPPPQKAPPLAPRSHTPLTHPRSFHSHSGPGSPGSLSYARRPPVPTSSSYRAPYHNSSNNSRPPNAPRALRGVSHANHQTQPPSYNTSPPSRPLGSASHPTPRGPSADRNRDWDRDRNWPGRDRVRSGSGSGWSR